MDYKYIENLLEKYWQCQTTLQEEEILRAFFSQESIPGHLSKYSTLFIYQSSSVKEEVTNDALVQKIMERVAENKNKQRRIENYLKTKPISWTQPLKPLFRAAAIVAIIITIGNAAQVSTKKDKNVTTEIQYTERVNGEEVAMTDSLINDSADREIQPQKGVNLIP